MVFFQIMASVACLDSAGIPEGKTDIRHQPGAHAAPVTQPHIGAYAGDAGNPCKLADAAVMVNRPCAGHHGNEGSPLQPIAHLVDIGKAGPFQLKRPIAGSFPFKLDKGQERIIPKLRITADADSIAGRSRGLPEEHGLPRKYYGSSMYRNPWKSGASHRKPGASSP